MNPEVVLRFEPQFYSTYAAFDSKRIETRFYSQQQFEVLEYLARKPSTFNEISQQTSFNEDQLTDFLFTELKTGFLIEADHEDLSPVHVPPRLETGAFEGFPSPFLSAPSTVDLFLTRACNLRCCHCFAEGGKPLANELSHEEWLSVLDQLEEMGVLQIRLNGGEPLMRRRILDILDYLKHKRFHKLMITNGTLLTERAVDALALSDVTPTVSLDGATAEVHDAFRGVPGAFDRTLKAVRLLKRKGITFGLNTCVHSENIGQIEDIIRLGNKMGAARIGLLGLEQVGRLARTKKNLVSGIEYILLSLKFLQLAKKYEKEIEVTQEIFPSEVPLKSIGAYTCSIDSNGIVYPTNRVLGDSRFRVGSVQEKSLREVWFSRNWISFRKGLDKTNGLDLRKASWKALTKAAP